ncbi:uncharacterized protein LOC122327211 [Puntigrus tetrazona]|uniref:uncharacterized protein LOC122327211 n=1 Tax=Puntigrus tetrazona TaxID=1606681 RepID=UPI001C8A9A40|nr:uncharacterized protein LOC122327211 [Puntigrus tetrazona]
MKIIQLQLYVLMWCHAAVADLITDLGSNVIINCDLDENEVYWILLKTADPPTVILQSFSTSSFYPNKSFRKKYSVQFKHRLVINNITADELGVYYCMYTRTPPKLSNSTRIYFEPTPSNQLTVVTECHNHTTTEYIDQNQTQWKIIIVISGLMNGLLVLVVVGLVNAFVVESKRSAEQSEQMNIDLQHMQVVEPYQDQLHYTVVNFSELPKSFFRDVQLWCFICVIAGLVNKVCLQVTGFIEGYVVLPCFLNEYDFKPQDINVLWRDKHSGSVYDLIQGQESLKSQNPRYKNRAQTFPKEYKRGNFSIKLNNLTHDDAGTYICFITHFTFSKQETVQLIINESTVTTGNQSTEEENKLPETQFDRRLLICVCTLVLLVILMSIIIGFILYWKRRTQLHLNSQYRSANIETNECSLEL